MHMNIESHSLPQDGPLSTTVKENVYGTLKQRTKLEF